jgi:hypothetical protein
MAFSSETRKEEKELRSADLSIHQCKEKSAPRYSDWTMETGYSFNIMNEKNVKLLEPVSETTD